jgi:phospholipid/cholesterol/gamma-HCH transport system substrate-binding protein
MAAATPCASPGDLMRVNERTIRILSGLITVVLGTTLSIFGVKVATGALDPVYHVDAIFDAAGQGLIRDSDVKVHGVNIGRVTKVQLVEGRARVRLEINSDHKVPRDAHATVRPKTLFGEKFVDIDPGPREATGPYFEEGDTFPPENTEGGFELERVLADIYPILKAVEPSRLATVLHTLAEGGEGLGDETNRTIGNLAAIMRVNAAHDADTRQFLQDFAALSDELARRADDLVAGATDLNDVLPTLNSRGDELTAFLEQASRLSADLSDVLEANRPYLIKAATIGGRTIQVLYDDRNELPALITALRGFIQVLAEVAMHEDLTLPDGTRMAAVKFAFGGGSLFRDETNNPDAAVNSDGAAEGLLGVPLVPLPTPIQGAGGVLDVLRGLLK